MTISVVTPAYNEEKYIGKTLEHLYESVHKLQVESSSVEIIVVDNASSDETGDAARKSGAIVINEPIQCVARARNTGARAARGEILIFLDADTIVQEGFLKSIAQVMSDPGCAGGAVDVRYRSKSFLVSIYLRLWRVVGQVLRMAQGAAQFCRRDVFNALGGYDQSLYMGEDVDFYWRLGKIARSQGLKLCYLRETSVITSSRRFDQWPFWRTLVWTNPLFILVFRHRKEMWRGWYHNEIR